MAKSRSECREPIAIVGMSCRFPKGANDIRQFWQLLESGVDAFSQIPSDRWDIRRFVDLSGRRPGKAYTDQGAFLDVGIDQFDPMFFGISPREAECMDPQQRLLLELTWETLEDAGIPLETAQAVTTGVFIGGFCLDNKLTQSSAMNRRLIDANTSAGLTMAILANRLSYVFDLKGPSITVDTACSSSLVATHLACQSIWHGESDCALAGGVNIMTRPEYMIAMSKGQFLSRQGRSMAFDARAGGYARGEGAGIVMLKPLSSAQRDGDHIHSVILATGVNQDGRTSSMPQPSGNAQEALIRLVYNNAGIAPDQIDYIEAHGTGTQIGDKTELAALERVFAADRSSTDPIHVGSVKTNIGHLEAGAGVAGLIKLTLCLENSKLVPNLHFDTPNPEIPFKTNKISVVTESVEWPNRGSERHASINSFGYGGTNAHAVLRSAPQLAPRPTPPTHVAVPFFLSAQSPGALRMLANRTAEWLGETDAAWIDITHSANVRRSGLDHRVTAFATDAQDLRVKLSAWAIGEATDNVLQGHARAGDLAFVYTGMGPQWWGMGRNLYQTEPVFAGAAHEVDAAFREVSGWSILDAMLAEETASQMHKTSVAQPANLLVQAALTALWRHWGVTPQHIVGHSIGEVGAAHAAGALSLHDAVTVAYHRSRLQQQLADRGGMMAIGGLDERECAALIEAAGVAADLSIGAINGLTSLTVSGPVAALDLLETHLDEQTFRRRLAVEVPYHSPVMEEIRDDFLAALQTISPQQTQSAMYSTVTGLRIDGMSMDATYWWRNVREPVRFADAMRTLLEAGAIHFLEVGPHPVLRNSVGECLRAANIEGGQIQSLSNKRTDEQATMRESLLELISSGVRVDLSAWSHPTARFTPLPLYPWQHESYWRESGESLQDRLGSPGPVWFDQDLKLPNPAWEVEFNEGYFPWIEDHVVQGQAIMPGAAFVEAAALLQDRVSKTSATGLLEDIRFEGILALRPDSAQRIQLHHDDDGRSYRLYAGEDAEDPGWRLVSRGVLVNEDLRSLANVADLSSLRTAHGVKLSPDALYQQLGRAGLHYGPRFRPIVSVCVSDSEESCLVELCDAAGAAVDSVLSTPLLDGCFQSIIALLDPSKNPGTSFIPHRIARLARFGPVSGQVWCHTRLTRVEPERVVADLSIYSAEGALLLDARGVTCRAVAQVHVDAPALVRVNWERHPYQIADAQEDLRHDRWLVLTDRANDEYAMGLQARAENCVVASQAAGPGGDTIAGLLGLHRPQNVLWILDGAPGGDDAAMISERLASLTAVAKALAETAAPARLICLTRTTQGTALSAASSAMARVISNEYASVKTSAIAVEGELSIEEILDDILEPTAERTIRLRANGRLVQRLSAISEQPETTSTCDAWDHAIKLEVGQTAILDSLHFSRQERRAPDEGEIEIRVHASAINYKDLLKVFGQLDADVTSGTYTGSTLGMEVAGTVVRVGDGVEKMSVGDRVVISTPDAFRSYVTVPTKYVVPVPEGLTFTTAPVMIGYLTAYRGLVDIARLASGEKVLIHNATGGVGIAALQVAQFCGAEIYATAGTDEKKAYLKSLGIQHIYHSRDLRFVEQIRRDTEGYGVDVVINAVAGETLRQSFGLLAPYGRFIEIGKRDIAENRNLPLLDFNRNLTFASVDIDRMFIQRVPLIQRLLRDICDRFAEGHFKPGPVTVFSPSEVSDAFRLTATGTHIGKVVINFENEKVAVQDTSPNVVRSEGTYLVTGGTSGFGLEVGAWLARQGAGRVVLASRSGDERIRDHLENFASEGLPIEAVSVDISDPGAAQSLVAALNADASCPLRGVFHGAMVLQDGLLPDMTQERYMAVLSPKIDGAQNLDAATRDLDLDHFVCFSSISSLVGNRGQANYVAANAALDMLAHRRRENGQRGLTINWGVLGETGVAHRSGDLTELLAASGMSPIATSAALELLGRALREDVAQLGAFSVDWSRLAAALPGLKEDATFAEFIASDDGGTHSAFVADLLLLPPEARRHEVEDRLCVQVAKVVKVQPENIERRTSLDKLGIDSLSIVELTILLEQQIGISFNTVELLSGVTVEQLAGLVLDKLITAEDELMADLDDMSEEDLDALLEQIEDTAELA